MKLQILYVLIQNEECSIELKLKKLIKNKMK